MTEGGAVDCTDDHRGADQGVLAQVHRGRPRMRLDTPQFQVEPFLAKGAQHHTDGFLFILKNRTLLDMCFEIGADLVPADLALPGVADGVQRLRLRCARPAA